MKQNNKIILLLAVFLMLMTVFTVPALAQEGEDPCIAAGNCVDPDPGDDETDPGDEDTDPDDEDFIEEEAISIYADGTTESMKLDHNIDSEETGWPLNRVCFVDFSIKLPIVLSRSFESSRGIEAFLFITSTFQISSMLFGISTFTRPYLETSCLGVPNHVPYFISRLPRYI